MEKNIESRVQILEIDVKYLKEDVESVKEHQEKSDNSMSEIKLMTNTLHETNVYIKEMINEFKAMTTKIADNQKEYQEKNDERYVEMIRANNQQDLECKDATIEDTKEKVKNIMHIVSPFITFALMGGIACYLVFVK